MKCPSCFVPIDRTRFTWLLTDGEQTDDGVASAISGGTVRNRGTITITRPADARRDWQPDPRVAKPNLRGPIHPACPNCHFRLPEDLRSSTITCIAMSGARATGKSLYIAVMIKQLRRLAQALGSVLEAANDRTRELYEQVYEGPLFRERGILQSTPAAESTDAYQREPLVWSLGMIDGKHHYISIRDVAGEDMERSMRDAPQFEFLRNADAVFFMFDPLAIESVRAKLAGTISAQRVSGARPQDVLSNLLQLIGARPPRVAVVLSKFDALQALVDVDDVTWRTIMSNAGAGFMRDEPDLTASYDAADGELLSEEVRSLLHRLDAADITFALQNPASGVRAQHRFFAVSVLGAAPEGQRLNEHGITPFRTLDPLKWTLFEEKVLAAQ